MLNELKTAVRNLPRRNQHNLAKILCLALGLAMSAVLIAEVYYEQTFDTCYEDWQQIYKVGEVVIRDGTDTYPQTSGAIGPGLKSYCPMVETATRCLPLLDNTPCSVGESQTVVRAQQMVLADSCYLSVLTTPMVEGDAKATLSKPDFCLVSRSLAEKLGGRDVVGQRLTLKEMPGAPLTIGGIYEDYPYNAECHDVDLIVSLPSIGRFTYDGRHNWVGNDCYITYVKLRAGHSISEMRPHVERMIKENLPLDELEKAGTKFNYSFTQLSEIHTSDTAVQKRMWILSLLAVTLLITSSLNYLLIVIGNMVGRAREMAVRKCYGAGRGTIVGMVFSEALLHLVLALAVAVLLVVACRGTIEDFLSAPLTALLINRGSWLFGVLCLVVLLIGGVLPGLLYSAVPVAEAFRGQQTARHRWKVALLAVQFGASALLLSLLCVVWRQYNMMMTQPRGYEFHDLAEITISGSTIAQREAVMTELRKMPEVAHLSSSMVSIAGPRSGNNVGLPGSDRELFNVADLYFVSDDWFDTYNVPIVTGSFFTERTDTSRQVMVSERFAAKMKTAAGWPDNPVGQRFWCTEHCNNQYPTVEVCGVYSDFLLGTLANRDDRPSVIFYYPHALEHISVRFHHMTSEVLRTVLDKTEKLCPGLSVDIHNFNAIVANQYHKQQSFRNAVLVGGIITLAITLLGLVGYTVDEVNRRHKEVAVRTVNGATAADVLRLFLRGTLPLALPSLLVGSVAGAAVANQWLQPFAERVALSPWIFAAVVLVLLAVAVATIVLTCRRTLHGNLVEYLKED